jgi:hypothetical protein
MQDTFTYEYQRNLYKHLYLSCDLKIKSAAAMGILRSTPEVTLQNKECDGRFISMVHFIILPRRDMRE